MSSSYKVSYFDVTALGEPIRFLLSYGGFDFEDDRIDIKKWDPLKETTPFGKVPLLEYNGKVAHQHMAICRYLGKKCKLVGNDEWEDLEIDSIADTLGDIRRRVGIFYYERDPAQREAFKESLLKELIPFYFQRFDREAKTNNGFLAIGKLTWADIYFLATQEYINFMLEADVVADFPNLNALRDQIVAIPNIKKWLETRPKETLLTPYYFTIKQV